MTEYFTAPQEPNLRKQLLNAISTWADAIPAAEILDMPDIREKLESTAREILLQEKMSESWTGWVMVMLGNALWRRYVLQVPPEKRLLLLPHCMKNQACPASYAHDGSLICENCGLCPLGALRQKALARGYKVMIAEGSPVVLNTIITKNIEAVLGVACLKSLEKAFSRMIMLKIPAMALPLLESKCQNSITDLDQLWDLVTLPYIPDTLHSSPIKQQLPLFSHGILPLLRGAHSLFSNENFSRFLEPLGIHFKRPDNPSSQKNLSPLMMRTRETALDYLQHGGKHFRPFITLAAYYAMRYDEFHTFQENIQLPAYPEKNDIMCSIPHGIQTVAVATEAFHKASLIHDDVEDADPLRYGKPTLHTLYGLPAAINLGDYLIGLGYRLVISSAEELGSLVTSDLLTLFSEAHTLLCEGQGSELMYQKTLQEAFRKKEHSPALLKPLDALRMYAMKTAPAFNAALCAGIRMAGNLRDYQDTLSRFCRHLGIAYQIANDLDNWEEDSSNKIMIGRDFFECRPTILMAFSLEMLTPAQLKIFSEFFSSSIKKNSSGDTSGNQEYLGLITHLLQKADIFDQTRILMLKHRMKALEIACILPHAHLSRLLVSLVHTILPPR